MNGLIVGDNFYQNPRVSIGRANGAHRVATVFRSKGIDVDVIDFFNSWTTKEIETYINRCPNLDFIGVSISFGKLGGKLASFLIDRAKEKFPAIKVIAGGSDVLRNDYKGADLYFRGFAEGAVDNIIEYLKTGKFDPQYVQNIKTHTEKNVVDCNLFFKNFNLSNLKTGYTERDFIQKNEVLTLETSRGCIFKCSFCNFPFIGKKKNEYIREKEDVKAELIENYQKYGTTRYLITDDTFNDNPLKIDMMYEISQEIDFELSFMCYARVDLIHAKEGQLKKMTDFGVKGMFFGIETFNPNTAKFIGKGFSGERLKQYLLEIREQYPALHITSSFIIGLPDESIEEVRENIHWILDNNASDSMTISALNIPVDNKVNYTSEFTKNWRSTGYEEMSLEELSEYKNFKIHQISDINNYVKHHIPWKNKHMNVIDANRYNEELHTLIGDKTSGAGWLGFTYAFESDDLQKHLHTKTIDFDWSTQETLVADFVAKYKFNKLNSM